MGEGLDKISEEDEEFSEDLDSLDLDD